MYFTLHTFSLLGMQYQNWSAGIDRFVEGGDCGEEQNGGSGSQSVPSKLDPNSKPFAPRQPPFPPPKVTGTSPPPCKFIRTVGTGVGPRGSNRALPSPDFGSSSKYVGAKSAPSKAFEYYLPHPLEFQTFLWPCIRNFSSILRSKVDLFMPSSYILALGSSWNFAKIVIWNVQVMFMLKFFFRPGRKWE